MTGEPRVLLMSDLFSSNPTNGFDADGTPVQPFLTTRVQGTGPYLKALGDCHITYDVRSWVDSNPVIFQVEISRDIENAALVQLGTLIPTFNKNQQRFTVGGDSPRTHLLVHAEQRLRQDRDLLIEYADAVVRPYDGDSDT